MGATHSYLSIEIALTAVVLAGALAIGYHQYTTTSGDAGSTDTSSVKKSKKKKRKAPEANLLPVRMSPSTSRLVGASGAIPGQFDEPPPASNSKPKKPKKKKAKLANNEPPYPPTLEPPEQPQTTSRARTHPQKLSTTSLDTDGSWTRVESRRLGQGDKPSPADVTSSDAGLTFSVTGNSSPVEEDAADKRETLVEKLLPKAPKTDVDDMLPEQPTHSRMMRIQPLPNEKPAPGFSWGDYDNVDADGEDDGWGIVKSKRPRPSRESTAVEQSAEKSTETQTKRQRQNANRREAEKAAKATAESERLARLANHKRELERIKMIEQAQSSGGKGKKTSGGMTPVVNERGKLVWE